MITPETVIALAIRSPIVMDQLGEALRSDLVTANPYYRRIAEFADDFLITRRKLPASGDWETWLMTLEEGMIQEGTKEALGRLLMVDTDSYDPAFFASTVIEELQKAAAANARARMNEAQAIEPAMIAALAEKVANVRAGSLQGLARLSDVNIWASPVREDELVGTGFPTLSRLIGGWGKELWLIFADSGVGKSILLQNYGSNTAVRGKNVLHITLELALRPQIHRYYRQIAEFDRAQFSTQQEELRSRLGQWLRLSKGSIFLIERPAYTLTVEELKRIVDRVNRLLAKEGGTGQVDMLIVDYLDLMKPSKNSPKGAYEELGFLTHETRSLCSMFDLTQLSASQAVRKPARAGRLTQKDMGDSYNKVRGVDGLLTLVQTPEEEEVFQGRLGIAKVRDSGGGGTEIPVYINRELSFIQELEHPNTVQLMRRLGQLAQDGRPVPPRTGGVGGVST